jgi:two-component system sensor histidine kinase and response regulator WspE
MSGSGKYAPDSMLELFQTEVASQAGALSGKLLELERNPRSVSLLEPLMRAAHSIKGAARIVNHPMAVTVSHALEDVFVAAQNQDITLDAHNIDVLLKGVDTLVRLSRLPVEEITAEESSERARVEVMVTAIRAILSAGTATEPETAPDTKAVESVPAEREKTAGKRVLRVNAANLDELMGLAGEALVETRRLQPFTAALLRLKRRQTELGTVLDQLNETLRATEINERSADYLRQAQQLALECRKTLAEQLAQLEQFDRRTSYLTHQIYHQASASRMRPFSEGVSGMPRMIRDLARTLGKEVRLEIDGLETLVDRDILEKIESPLNHLLTNALDHGIEFSEERLAAGKPAEGIIRLEAHHSAGMLIITVSDDGMGIPLELLRRAVVEKKLSSAEMVASMSESELLEFLFLPKFSMKDVVTEISGRGVGLDVVLSAIQHVRGAIRIFNTAGRGTRFQLQLPLTLSVVQGLLVSISGEPYAFPLARIDRTLKLDATEIFSLEGREYFLMDGERIGLVAAYQVFGLSTPGEAPEETYAIVVISDRHNRFGVVVDRFLGERSLVVQALDPRLGKIKDISAATLMENGDPALVVDVDDLVRSIDKLVSSGHLNKMEQSHAKGETTTKRVLVVDDSFTVREVERKLLENSGYQVDVAVDGMDGWNAVRTGSYDLVVSDIDMPRMNGIELVNMIRKDQALKNLPVMIVSYKDREEDRRSGLEAGANYYFTKGSFHDEALLEAVIDLIGEAAQ